MAIKFNRSQTFATNGTVTAAGLHNLIDGTDIYQALITDQPSLTSVATDDSILIADASLTAGDAPRQTTVSNLFDDALTGGTYTNINLTGAITFGTATGNRTVSTSATITTGTIPNLTVGTTASTAATITTGTIPALTSGTTTSTAANITNGTIQTLTSSTATITGGTFSGSVNSTSGTIATLNSTTGTIANFSTTLAGDFTISQGTATLGTTGATVGTYGTSGAIPVISVNSKGLVTTISTSVANADNSIAYAKFLSTDWTNSHGASGHQKLPSGLIIQWGSGTAVNNTSISFPITFPTTVYCVIASCSNVGASRIVNAGSVSTTGFVASGFVTNTAAYSSGEGFYYIALGK